MGDPPDLPPRPFPLRALGAGGLFGMIFGGIWMLVGIVIATVFTIGGGGVWNDVILGRRGVTANATPVAIEPTGATVNGRRVFRVVYTFRDREGRFHQSGGGTTDQALLARANERQPLSIDYDPERPSRSRLTGGSASFFGWFVLFPLGFAVVGAVAVAIALRRILRTRAIYIHGTAAEAEVTGQSSTNMRINGRRVTRIHYQFDALIGLARGTSTSVTPPPVGARIWVIYRPDAPNENVPA